MKEPFENINNELEELGSFLAGTRQADPELPNGYFEQLETDILRKTVMAGNQKTKTLRLRRIYYAASAAAVILLFLGIKLFSGKTDQSLEMKLAEMSKTELDHFMSDQIASITADDLHTYITNNIGEIEAGLFAETELIDNETMNNRINSEVNLQILSDQDLNKENTEPLLDKNLLEQIDEETIEQLLNDESMYDDFAL